MPPKSATEWPVVRRRHKKSRYGCAECKRRHMKCDETRPSCVNCKTGNRVCSLRNISANFPQVRGQGYKPYQQCSGQIATNSWRRLRENGHEPAAAVTPRPCFVQLPPLATPYSTARELEAGPSLWPKPYGTPTGNPLNQEAGDQSRGFGEHFLQCLTEAGLAIADAQEMFGLFGGRIAPMIPSFHATSFTHLPSQPLFALAAIYTVARYLPDSENLRSRVFRVLRRLLLDLLLQPAGDQQTQEVFENMHGLVILVAYCEATGPSSGNGSPQGQPLHALTLKGIVEGYAVKHKIGIGTPPSINPPGLLPQVWLVWLYTVSHHSSVIDGCVRTLSSTDDIRQAKQLLEQHVSDPQVQALLGEYELCLIWENLSVQRRMSLQTVHDALHQWQFEWNHFLASVHGLQLRFHYLFTRFHLVTHLLDDAGQRYVALPESLEAAKDFIQYLQNLSPLHKDRLRYCCDFAFVLMVYVCLYILRSLDNRVIRVERREEFLLLVKDLALQMQSFSVKADTRPAIYGCALEGLCKQYASSDGDVPVPLSPSLLVNTQQSNQEPCLLQPLSQQTPRISENAPMNHLVPAPELMQQSQFLPDLWSEDPQYYVLDGIMAVIPVPGV